MAANHLLKYRRVGLEAKTTGSHQGVTALITGSILTHHFSGSRVVHMTTASGKASHSSPTNRMPGASVTPTYPARRVCSVWMVYASLVLGGLGSRIEIHPSMKAG